MQIKRAGKGIIIKHTFFFISCSLFFSCYVSASVVKHSMQFPTPPAFIPANFSDLTLSAFPPARPSYYPNKPTDTTSTVPCNRPLDNSPLTTDGNSPLTTDGNSPLPDPCEGYCKQAGVPNFSIRVESKTPLHDILYSNTSHYLLQLKELLTDGADPNESQDGAPFLISAIKNREPFAIIQLLLSRHANIHTADQKGRTPLHYAAASENEELIIALSNNSQKVDINAHDKEDKTPLYYAAEINDENAVALLLAHGAHSDEALYHAIDKKKYALVDRLQCYYHANMNIGLLYAILTKNADAIDTLATYFKVDINKGLLYAIRLQNYDAIKTFLTKFNANIFATNKKRIPLLHYAAATGCDLNALLNPTINVNTQDAANNTPLIYAAGNQHEHNVDILVENYHANVNIQNNKGQTALHCAVMQKNAEQRNKQIVANLIRHGARIDIADENGKTSLDLASDEMKKLIIEEREKHHHAQICA